MARRDPRVRYMSAIETFLKDRKIEEVECLVPDMAGIGRGKILPAERFLSGMKKNGLRIPEALFVQTVTGDYPRVGHGHGPGHPGRLPGSGPRIGPPRALVSGAGGPGHLRCLRFQGCARLHRRPPRAEAGARPLCRARLAAPGGAGAGVLPGRRQHRSRTMPLEPPVGRSGRRETSRQAYGVDAVNEFDPLFEEVYDFCEAQNIRPSTP